MEVVFVAIENAHSSAVTLKVNAGVRQSTGGMIVKSVSLGKIMSGANKDKIMSVVGALLPVLEHPMFRVERRITTIIEN